MKIGSTVLFTLTILCASPAFPHGEEKHGENHPVMGTVTAVDTEHLVLKGRDGKTVSIKLTKDTKYLVGEVAAPASDVKVGDRAVVDVAGKEDNLTATQVRLGSHKPPAGADEGKRQHQDGQHGTHEHSEPHK